MLLLSLLGCSQTNENTPVPAPFVTPKPGWQKINAEGFQMLLPESYIIGTSIDFDSIINSIRKMGPQFEDAANTLNQNREAIIAFAVDKRTGDSGIVTKIIIGKISWANDESVKTYMDGLIDNLPGQIQVIQSEIFSDRTYPMFQLTTGINTPQTGNIKQVAYGAKNGDAIWQIVFTTPSDEYETRLSEFEQIVDTIVIPFSEDNTNDQNGKSTTVTIGVILVVAGLIRNALYRRRKKQVE